MVESTTSPTTPTFTAERRADCRYTIRTGLEYKWVERRQVLRTGAGSLTNISRNGLLFECDRDIPASTRIELNVDWPAQAIQVSLHVTGETIRSQGSRIAVRILHSAFRVREDTDRG
jgi:hypothetical protein